MKFLVRRFRPVQLTFLVLPLVLGCARAPIQPDTWTTSTPVEIAQHLCELESGVREVRGRAWFKLEQGESSQSFPALIKTFRGDSPSKDRSVIEVTNLIGATEVVAQIQGSEMTLDGPALDSKTKNEASRSGTWNGIPIRWVGRLLRGAVPCPDSWESYRVEKGPLSSSSLLEISAFSPSDQMSWRAERGSEWAVKEMMWKNATQSLRVIRSDFDDQRHPKTLELGTARGKVTIKWRERDVVR